METYLYRRNVWMLLVQIVFVRFIRFSDAECSITTPGVNTFGPECQYMCHCKNGESCDTTTGECTSGCDRYWFGPGCQYRDLAENEFSRHASNLISTTPQYALRGNDGNTSTCSYTKEAINSTVIPWWRVILEDEVTITDIYILTTTDVLQYFREFKVTVEKLPYEDRYSHGRPPNTSVCYKHDNTIPDSTNIHVTCTTPLIGNQVRITLSEKQSQLIVCDFRINRGRNLAFRQSVTSSAIYQFNTTSFQAAYAVNGLVSNTNWLECFVTGTFSNKWLQVEFDRSIDVYFFNVTTLRDRYDYIDNYRIHDTTSVKELLHDSGSDLSPAIHGYLNKTVQKITIEKTTGDVMVICELKLLGDCPVNQCGYDCSKVCHCKSITIEDKISGICTSGCDNRWTGENGKCDVECAYNKWGTSCQNECGACRQGTCDVVTGKCTGGCQDGYYITNDNCKTVCVIGLYGYNCQSKCSEHCKNSCDKVNGKCIDGCNPGYVGDKCEQECPDGKYGANCAEMCTPRCLNACNKQTGDCSQCKDGWTGNTCQTECIDGMYGPNCKHSCSAQCTNVCAKDNGYCNCMAGWYGDTCHDECPAGYFGEYCKNTCSKNCGVTCQHVDGSCTSCKAGWKGNHCTTECDDGTYGVGCINICSDTCYTCDKVNGVCSSCVPGWTGITCENKCRAGTYGLNCNNRCNSNCVDICNHVTGKCIQCVEGWNGDYCEQECEDGTYGTRCLNKCTDKCLVPCDKVSGVCTLCKAGWTGTFCAYECPVGTFGLNCNVQCNNNCVDICDRVTGKCTQCVDGWKGDFCDQEIITTEEQPRESNSSGLIAAIAGSASAIVVIIIIVSIVCIICLRKRTTLTNQPDTELANRQGNGSNPVIDNAEAYWTDLQRQDATQTTQNNAQENDNDYDIIQQK